MTPEKKKDKVKKNGRKARFEAKQNAANGVMPAAEDTKQPKEKGKKLERFKSWFKNLKTWKKVLLITGVVLLVVILIGGAVAYSYFNSIFDEVHEETPEDYDLSLTDVDGYYNILLLGVDSRDMDNIKGTRSDAIMMVSINKDTNDVKILSVYRDTYLKLGDTSTYDKITHACAYGGPEMTMKSLNQAMDLNISNYVVVNFKAVADIVNEVGGIEVDVQDYEIEQLNKYTIETAENIGQKKHKLVESPGMQTLEGVQAVSYGRIRKGVGDDFKRTERMRTVISLVMDKMKDMSIKDMKKVIKMMTPQVQTNLSKSNIIGLAVRLPQYNIVGNTGWPYNVTTGYIGGASYVFPSDLLDNVIKLHNDFFGQADYSPSSVVRNISSTIIQKIEAARQAQELENETPPEAPGDNTGNDNPGDKPPVEPENPGEVENPDNPGTTEPDKPGGENPDNPSGGITPDTPEGGDTPVPPENGAADGASALQDAA